MALLRRATPRFLCVALVAIGVLGWLADFRAQERQVPGAFRSAATVVPVDVRVLDESGNPVTDLAVADFEVLENGLPQVIQHLVVQHRGGSDTGGVTPSSPSTELIQAARRTFLVVLGRGRLQEPAKGLDAVIRFLRKLPATDQVGVIAYRHSTEVTVDHEGLVRLLEAYALHHERIETRLDHWFSGLQAAYGSRDVPQGIQQEIDKLLGAPGLPAMRELPYAGLPGIGQFEADRQRLMASLDPNSLGERDEEGNRLFIGNEALRQDLEQIYAGLEYLRYVNGEKHLIFVSEEPYVLGQTTERISAMAADARVTISLIQTSGLPLQWLYSRDAPAELVGRSWDQVWAFNDAKALVSLTGGVGSFYQDAARGLDEIDRATGFQYILGYYPPDTPLDGSFRAIQVKVNRPGVTVSYRHGYYAQRALVPTDLERFLPFARITGAGAQITRMRDIAVTVSVPQVVRAAGQLELRMEVRIDASTIAFERDGDHRVAQVELAVFVGDNQEAMLGELWERIDLRVPERSYQRLVRDGIVHAVKVKVTSQPRQVKAVAYDPATDRLGSVAVRVGVGRGRRLSR
jgi:VWFA-related protein